MYVAPRGIIVKKKPALLKFFMTFLNFRGNALNYFFK